MRTCLKLTDSEACARQALSIDPHNADTLALLADILKAEGRTPEAVDVLRRVVDRESEPASHSNWLLGEQYMENVSAQNLLSAHREWNNLYAKRFTPASLAVRGHRLQIQSFGSGSSRETFEFIPLDSWCFRPCEREIARNAMSYCIQIAFLTTHSRRVFRETATEWRSISGLTDSEVAERIALDEIDVLV